MALVMQYADQFGHDCPASYWWWTGCRWDVPTNQAALQFRGYVSQAAYEAGAEPVGQVEVTVQGQDFLNLVAQLAPALTPTAYGLASGTEFFAAASLV